MEREGKEREKNIKQVIQDLKEILAFFPEDGTFRIVDKFFLHPDKTIKSIAEWVDIDINFIPRILPFK